MIKLPAGVGIKRDSIENTSPVVFVGTKSRCGAKYAPHCTEGLRDCNFFINGVSAGGLPNTRRKRSSLQRFWGVFVPWTAVMEVSPRNCPGGELSV